MLAWRAPEDGPAATPKGAPDPFADRPRFDRKAALTKAVKAAARAAKSGPDGMVPIAEAPAGGGAERIDWTHFDRRARAFATEDLARDRDAFDAAWRREITRPRIGPVSPADKRARMDIKPDPNRLPKTEQDAWVAARAAELKRRRTLIQELLDAEAADDAREIDARAKGLRRRAETELSDIDWAEVARSGVERGTSDGPESDSPTPADGNAGPTAPPPLLDPAALTDAAQEEADGLGLAGEGHDTQPEDQASGVQVAVAPTHDRFGNPMLVGMPDPYQGLMIGGGAAAAGGAAASLPDSEGANSGGGPWDWLTDFFSSDKTDANAPTILPSEGDPSEGEDVYRPAAGPARGAAPTKPTRPHQGSATTIRPKTNASTQNRDPASRLSSQPISATKTRMSTLRPAHRAHRSPMNMIRCLRPHPIPEAQRRQDGHPQRSFHPRKTSASIGNFIEMNFPV